MSVEDPGSVGTLHPTVAAAARGTLPQWAVVAPRRWEHITRVGNLLQEWARARGESPVEEARWVASGYLHDALRDEAPDALRRIVDAPFQDFPGKALHGPGSARRLRDEGVDDEELLHAVAYHTFGSAEFGTLGFALFAADFLEPGRKFREDWRADLRRRAPSELNEVVKEILAARIGYQVEKGRPVHPRTLGFWNRISEGQPWASASEY